MKKALFLTNIPVPYRMNFFNELGKYVDLTVVFERTHAKTREDSWLESECKNFQGIFMKGIPVGDDCAFCPEIISIIKKGKYDVIIVGAYYTPTGMMAIEYMKTHHIPYGFSGDGGFIKDDTKIKYQIKTHLQKNGQFYFSPSQYADRVVEHYGADKNVVYRYPFTSLVDKDILPVPPSRNEKDALKIELGINEEKVVLGVGRLVGFKAWEYLPIMAKQLGKNVGVYLIGGNPSGSCYEKIFATCNEPNFHVVDFKKKEELWKWYKAADVLIFPTRGDVWGLVVNEALACGLPVVTTTQCVSGVELIKNSQNGYIVDVDDLDAMMDKILDVLEQDDESYNVMQNHALETIRPYTIHNMARAYATVIEHKF